MRKTIFTVVLVATMGVSGCATWWQNFQNDPVASIHSFEQGVQIVLSDAQIAWVVVQPMLPAANAAQITTQYNNAVFAVNHALTALNDAVNAAAAAKQPNPDFSKLMVAVTDAVGQVLAIIDQYKTSTAPSAGTAVKAPVSIPALDEAHAGLDNIKKHWIH